MGARNCHRVNRRECLIRFEAQDSEDKGAVTVFYFTKVEEAEFGTRKEVWVATFFGIGINLMSRSAPSTRDDEKFAVHLKPFVGMAVPTEK